MKIKSLTFINHKTGWNIKDAQFDNTTLLVGASGVGKTQMLRALQMLSHIATGYSFEGIEWAISFSQNGKEYQWTGEFGLASYQDPLNFTGEGMYPIVKECLMEGETVLIQRSKSELWYRGKETVKLDSCTSALSLLKEEECVNSPAEAFNQVYELDVDEILPAFNIVSNELLANDQTLDYIKKRRLTSMESNLYLLKKNKLPEFKCVSDTFISIFPLVEEIDFTLIRESENVIYTNLHIKEKGVHTPISYSNMSSGMRKTLSQITALTLAKDGDVILIDEFENGLGVNCIDLLADLVRNPDADVQMIITSHHPYIINTIPTSQWKVVTRNGSDVSIHNASELNIGTHSHHDAFMQLLQTNAYKTGQL